MLDFKDGIYMASTVKAVYERLLVPGKSKMSALGAAMRKQVHFVRWRT
ncbi:hypothetical protein NTG1052_20043 [Candidatus Nitrotoga sp. 1052]|nr:hypothetical protein NTG1052_20043 [Candidatus Nitrotoga sp. 1052]